MKLIKIIVVIVVAAAIYYFLSPQIPAMISVKNLTPVYLSGNEFSVDVTLTNYTIQPKEIYLTSSDLAAATSVYVDYTSTPDMVAARKETAVSVLTIPPLGHKTISINPRITGTSSGQPQAIAGNSSVLPLSQGSHTFMVSIGGYITAKKTFSVQ